jgi:hypothetical protein
MNARFLAVPVQVDRERLICIDFNTLCEAEKECNVNFIMDMNLPLSFHGMRAICWASWKKDDPTLTLVRTGEILQDHWPKVMSALTEAWLGMIPIKAEGDQKIESNPMETTVTVQS